MNTLNNTLFFGKVCIALENTASTNAYAQELLLDADPPEGTVIFTSVQTNGKGHFGSKWHSEPHKNIAVSVILYPKFLAAADQFLLNMAVSLGVHDALSKFIPTQTTIKWPNDIYILNHKIAGILIESSISGHHMQNSIIGIGINVNQEKFDVDLPNPSSLRIITGKDYDIQEVLEEVCVQIEKRYLQLRQKQHEQLRSDYLSHLYRLGRITHFKQGGREFYAIIKGISPEGMLILLEDSRETKYGFKQIEFLLPRTM